MKTIKKDRYWIVFFGFIALISLSSLFWKHQTVNLHSNFNSIDDINAADVAWLLTASCLVLLMTPGLAFFYGGMVGRKNVISTMLKSFICLGLISIIWVVVGFSLSFGTSFGITINGIEYGIIGNPFDFMFFDSVDVYPNKSLASTIPFVLFALFQMKFAVITPAIITGALAERIRFDETLPHLNVDEEERKFLGIIARDTKLGAASERAKEILTSRGLPYELQKAQPLVYRDPERREPLNLFDDDSPRPIHGFWDWI